MIGEVYRRAFAASVVDLVSSDRGVRTTNDPEAVHEARVALRRLRSYLWTFRPILDVHWANSLRERMRWLDDRLGKTRDLDVLVAALERRVAEPSTNGAPSQELLERLRAERDEGHASVHASLREPRYLALMEEIVGAARSPRFTDDAARPARKTARKLVRKVWRRARRRVRAYEQDPGERTLHAIRIKAKHVRYAAECFAPLAGKCAKRLARRAGRLQTLLGDHRDAVAAAAQTESAPPPAPDWQPVWKKMERAYCRLV